MVSPYRLFVRPPRIDLGLRIRPAFGHNITIAREVYPSNSPAMGQFQNVGIGYL
jgi:hypothetical protein